MSKCTFLHWLDLCMGGGWVGGGDPGELGKVGPRLTSPLPHLSLCPVFQCGHSRERRENRDRQTDGQTGWQTPRERGKRRGRYIHTTTHTRARAERERGGGCASQPHHRTPHSNPTSVSPLTLNPMGIWRAQNSHTDPNQRLHGARPHVRARRGLLVPKIVRTLLSRTTWGGRRVNGTTRKKPKNRSSSRRRRTRGRISFHPRCFIARRTRLSILDVKKKLKE